MKIGKSVQLKFFEDREVKSFGGKLLKGKRKGKRPFSPKASIHVVLKSSKAKQNWSFWKKNNKELIESIVRKQAQLHFVRLYRFENVGTHIHLVIRVKIRQYFRRFLRAVTGLIARSVMGAERDHAILGEEESFWDYRPFTRLIHWGRDFRNIRFYMDKNYYETQGYNAIQARFLVQIDRNWQEFFSAG